jgi:polysaccharide pyruvyl transferase WcaK-like protein
MCRNRSYDDRLVSEAFSRAFPRGMTEMVEHDGDYARTYRSFETCTHAVAMRLHGAVFSYTAELPFLMLSYHPKCDEFASMAGLDSRFRMDARGEEFDFQDFESRLTTLLTADRPNAGFPVSEARLRALENFRPDFLSE